MLLVFFCFNIELIKKWGVCYVVRSEICKKGLW